MGWNHTCFLSNLSVSAGTDVALMTLIQTESDMGSCRPSEHYYPAPVMIYGKYDDYGGIEDCHGSEINYLLKEFVDCGAIKEEMTVEEYSREGDAGGLKLFQQNVSTFHKKLKGDKTAGTDIQHVVINMRILERFLEQYYFTDYHVLKDADAKPTQDNYIPINYEYLCDLIPEYIVKLKEHTKYDENETVQRIVWEPVPNLGWEDPDILGRWIYSFAHDVTQNFYRTSFIDRIQELARENKDEELTSCLQEFVKYMMIYSYMNYSRRVYIRPQCSSQETDPIAHKLMAEITLAEIEQQRLAWEEEEDYPEDMWDPKREVFMEQCEIEF